MNSPAAPGVSLFILILVIKRCCSLQSWSFNQTQWLNKAFLSGLLSGSFPDFNNPRSGKPQRLKTGRWLKCFFGAWHSRLLPKGCDERKEKEASGIPRGWPRHLGRLGFRKWSFDEGLLERLRFVNG